MSYTPMPPDASERIDSGRIASGWFVAVVVLAALCYGVCAGVPGSYKVDEPKYFATALTAQESGDWIVLHYIDHPRLRKPPLQTWLVLTSYQLFGVGLWQARLPSILAGVCAVGLAMWLSTLLFASRRAALYTGCVLLASSLFLRQAHWALTDVGLACFVLLVWCGFALAVRGSRLGAPLAWVAMGLAFLQKGPAGPGLPILAFGAWLLVEGRSRTLSWRLLFDPLGIGLFALIVLPWPLLIASRLGSAEVAGPVGDELGFHLTWSAWGALRHSGEYSWALIRSVLPFTPILLFFRARESRSSEVRLLLYWVAAVFLVFTLVVLKHRWRYMLPAVPALAILAGHAIDVLQRRREQGAPPGFELRLLGWTLSIWFGVAAIRAGGVAFTALHVVATPAYIAIASAAAVFAALLAVSLAWLQRSAAVPAHVWIAVAAFGVVAFETVDNFVLPAGLPTAPAWELADRHLRAPAAGRSAATLGLDDRERGWAWLGAARSLPHHDVPAPGGDWTAIVRYDLLLVGPEDEQRMPDQVRRRYRVLEAFDGASKELQVVWRARADGRDPSPWPSDEPPVLLLEKLPDVRIPGAAEAP